MKKYYIYVWLFILINPLYSQKETTHAIVEKITTNTANDSLKVKGIYDWVTSNITYDHRFRRRPEGDTTLYQEPNIVIERKKAVCIGYAKLIKEMCRLAHIQAEVITGYAKNNGRLESEEHAWNAVNINQNWYLLDATWGADDAQAAKIYYLTDPSVFARNHLPHDPMWQLLESPISWACYTEGVDCFDKKTFFNYRDTLSNWYQMDTLDQKFNANQRILRFNPKDLDAMRGLAEYYGIKAYHFLEEYTQVRQAIKDKKRPTATQGELLHFLDNASAYLQRAIAQQEGILPYAKPNRYTDAHINIDILKENLANIDQEKAFILKYIKK
jgi:hypothetical protein